MFGTGSSASHASRRVLIQVLIVAAIVTIASLFAAPEARALRINEVRYTGPVAYELKSLQTTRFWCTVDTPGVWATLRIKDGQGRVVRTIYSGPIQEANKRFYFPLWNGLDDNGQRLFSASWNWELTVNKGGAVATKTGKITVSKIEFFLTGRVSDLKEDLFSRYMIPGNANIYIRTSTSGPFDAFMFGIVNASGYEYISDPILMDRPNRAVNTTVYLRGSNAMIGRGMNVFVTAGYDDVYYYMTVIQ